jgi:hypothetical protein
VQAREIARVASPRGAIPWQLLEELSVSGTGVFSDVAFVQRIDTAGGVAPPSGCDATTVNTETRVPDAADDSFYVSKERTDAGASD